MAERRKRVVLVVGGVVALGLAGWVSYSLRGGQGVSGRKGDRASVPVPAAKAVESRPVERAIEYVMPSSDEAAAEPTSFAMAAAVGREGLYFGTDNDGVWWRDPAAGWTKFDTGTGLGENAVTAMATDLAGRIWVGHCSQGVSVFDGEQWGRYDALHGPLSGHTYGIAACPTDGDVWMATDAGLTRYRQKTGEWQSFTAADGLPSNQVRSVAFGRDGSAYVGLGCEGVAMARAADGYRTWTSVRAAGHMPLSAAGSGLPCNVVTSILVGRDGTVYAATTSGLGTSKDNGASWSFMRGADWPKLVRGLKGEPEPEMSNAAAPLAEDWCTALAEDGAGRIWIGHRHLGSSVLEPSTGQVSVCSTGGAGGGIRMLVALPGTADVLVGTYGPDKGGGGGFRIGKMKVAGGAPAALTAAAPNGAATLPANAAAPSVEELRAMAARVDALPAGKLAGGWIGEDWMTHGDWVGRYGKEFADIAGGPTPSMGRYGVSYVTGPHTRQGQNQTWHYVAHSTGDDPYWLWSPIVSSRCIGEINDGGWNDQLYPTTWEGPDLWITFRVPEGVYRVTPFFIGGSSADGHFRDYVVELKSFSGDVAADDSAPPLASARVTDYWHSLYSQFVINKAGQYAIKVRRCQSHMAGVNGLMIDRLDVPDAKGRPGGYSVPTYGEADLRGQDEAATGHIAAAVAVCQALDRALGREGNFALQRPYRLLAYRAAVAAGAGQALLDNWRWKLCLWTDADRAAFAAAMKPAVREDKPGEGRSLFP